MQRSVKSEIQHRRRLRAVHLHERGWRVIDIAHALQVSSAAVSQWLRSYREHGIDGLSSTPRTGAPMRLTPRHQQLLRALVHDAPSTHGIDAQSWDRNLLQHAIERLFGVRYSLQHVGRLLRKLLADREPLPKVTRLELHHLLKKSDIARIRSRIKAHHGNR